MVVKAKVVFVLSGSRTTAGLGVADALAVNHGWSVGTILEAEVPAVGLPETVSEGIKPTWKVILTRLCMQLQWGLNPPRKNTEAA